jgi:hypothetical protein
MWRLTSLAVLGLLGCVQPQSDNDTDTDTDTAVDTDSSDTGDVDETLAQLTGSIVWEDGSPATTVQVRLCYVSCSTADPDEAGVYRFTKIKPGPYTLQFVRHGDRSFSTPHGLVTLADAELRTLAPISVPLFQTRTDLIEAGPVVIDGGLTVQTDLGVMVKGPYSFSEETYLSAVKVDPGTSGIPFDGLDAGDTVVGMWYLGAYDFQVEPPWSFSGTIDLGVPEGTVLRIRTSSNDTKTWLEGGTATVGANQLLTSDLDSGVNQLTTLLLVLESPD